MWEEACTAPGPGTVPPGPSVSMETDRVPGPLTFPCHRGRLYQGPRPGQRTDRRPVVGPGGTHVRRDELLLPLGVWELLPEAQRHLEPGQRAAVVGKRLQLCGRDARDALGTLSVHAAGPAGGGALCRLQHRQQLRSPCGVPTAGPGGSSVPDGGPRAQWHLRSHVRLCGTGWGSARPHGEAAWRWGPGCAALDHTQAEGRGELDERQPLPRHESRVS